jgi:hypothetical protein
MAQGRFFEEPLSPSPQQPTVREPTVRERQLEAEVERLRAAAATGAGQSPVSLRGPSFTYLLTYVLTISAQNTFDTRLLSGLYCCVLVEILSSERESDRLKSCANTRQLSCHVSETESRNNLV